MQFGAQLTFHLTFKTILHANAKSRPMAVYEVALLTTPGATTHLHPSTGDEWHIQVDDAHSSVGCDFQRVKESE